MESVIQAYFNVCCIQRGWSASVNEISHPSTFAVMMCFSFGETPVCIKLSKPAMRKNNYDNYQMSSTQSNWFIYHFMALARLLIIFRPSFRSENGRFSSSAQCFIRCKIKGAISIRARCRWKGVTSRYLSFKPEQRCNLKDGRDGLERSVNF